MKLHRFFIEQDLSGPNIRLNDQELFNQTRNVLHLKSGEDVILFNGDSQEVVAKIVEYGKDSVFLERVRVYENSNEPKRELFLYCSVLKKENFELVVQKAVEIGASKIIPVISDRTIKMNLRIDRLCKIAKEAAEQSGRAMVPQVHEPMSWEMAVGQASHNEPNFLFDPSGAAFENSKFPAYFASEEIENSPLGIWIGPEGGWSEWEIKKAEELGFQVVSLGRLTLRAETAAIIASYLSSK